jgi:hypothetical protein
MDYSSIDDEDDNINVSGKLAFNKSESVESDGDENTKNVVTLSEHFNIDRNKVMDYSSIDEEEDNTNVSGKMAFNKSESVESDGDENAKSVVTILEHFNIDKNKVDSKPLFETGKTWLSKLSSSASYSSSLGRRKSSLPQANRDNDNTVSPSKPIGHWPDLLLMDKNEPCSTLLTKKVNGKIRGGVSRKIYCIEKMNVKYIPSVTLLFHNRCNIDRYSTLR